MASQHLFYPLSSVIRCLAKSYLAIVPDAYATELLWDEALFTELSDTLLQPTAHLLLASPYGSRDEAAVVERQLARLLADTYRHIALQRQDERIKRLNTLL